MVWPDQLGSVFLSGPMSGWENYNFAAFEEAAQVLRSHGVEVHSPRELDLREQAEAGQHREVLAESISFLARSQADTVVLLAGWRGSPGALAEVAFANAFKLKIVEFRDIQWPVI